MVYEAMVRSGRMAIHISTPSLIHEALSEYVAIAEHCITTGKPTGGCYGFPTALLCFTIVDTIGSFYCGDRSFTINIDQKTRTIDGNRFKHYFILNSDYYGQSLREKDIKKTLRILSLPFGAQRSISAELRLRHRQRDRPTVCRAHISAHRPCKSSTVS